MSTLHIEVRGQRVEVNVSSRGEFQATWSQNLYTADTLAKLREKLVHVTAAAKAKIDPIPFTVIRRGKVCDGVVVGRHAGNRNLLVQWEGFNKAEQVAAYEVDPAMRLDKATHKKLADLVSQQRKTETAIKQIQDRNGINIKELVDSAVERAIQGETGNNEHNKSNS